MTETPFFEDCTNYLLYGTGGVLVAAADRSELWTITGATIAGSGFMGLLATILASIVPSMRVGKLDRSIRFLANWLFGLNAIWLSALLQPRWFPDDDIVFVALGLSAGFSLFGVVVFETSGDKIINKINKYVIKNDRDRE